jgi:iron complex outermembrane receptor protein
MVTSLYANFATAFETPTATELNNSEGVSGGINRDLEPQRARTIEIGVKGLMGRTLQYDIALFHTGVRNELIPFEILNSGGRRFFRNAGRTVRSGAEGGITLTRGALTTSVSYSYSDFIFDEYVVGSTDFEDKRIPGVPVHLGQLGVTWRARGYFVSGDVLGSSKIQVDDGNTAAAEGYVVMNVRAGATATFGRPWLSPIVGIQNVFDTQYVGSVSVNASGGKYYEPAPGRVVYVGLTAAFGR